LGSGGIAPHTFSPSILEDEWSVHAPGAVILLPTEQVNGGAAGPGHCSESDGNGVSGWTHEAKSRCFMLTSHLGNLVTYKTRLLEYPGCERNEKKKKNPRFDCTLVVAAGISNS